MARLARIVLPGVPHYVTQRGNRRQVVFFNDDDYQAYKDLLAEFCGRAGVAVWSYCLMPNQVHLILVPGDEDGLRRGLGEAHRRYTRRVNQREDWRGHLWQERFQSFAMDRRWLIACTRYVARAPVDAGLVRQPEDWPWSSAGAHLSVEPDGLVDRGGLAGIAGDWTSLLATPVDTADVDDLLRHSRTGRPAGDEAFLAEWERRLGRTLRPRSVGRPRKSAEDDAPN